MAGKTSGGALAAIIVAIVGVLVLCVCGVAVGGFLFLNSSSDDEPSSRSSDVVDFRTTQPDILTNKHAQGRVEYTVSPPVGGDHNARWQNCQGDVYTEQIPNEHAVHSMEHGAVWITYRPDLSADEIQQLAQRVRGKDYMLMSPYPGLDKPISLQAWGYQLKVVSVDDSAIDEFIRQYRMSASIEPGAPCSSGTTVTGEVPE